MSISCKRAAERVRVSDTEITVSLSGMTVVKPTDFHERATWRIEALADRIGLACGAPCSVCDAATEAPKGRLILLGSACGTEKDAMLSKLKEGGFVIRADADRILICGTTNYLTQMGIAYFIENYLSSTPDITLPECICCDGIRLLPLAEREQCRFRLIHNNDQDSDSGNCPEPHGPGNLATNPDQVDFGVHACKRIGELLVQLTGCEAVSVRVLSEEEAVRGPAIYMGCMALSEIRQAHASVSPNEYGLMTTDTNIMILAWNDTALMKAYQYFRAVLRDSYVTDDKGYRTYYLPANVTEVLTMETEWAMSFPKPTGEGLTLCETVDVGDGALEYIYEGSGATLENYRAYCEKLCRNGYEYYNRNRIVESEYATLVDREAGIALHVSYSGLPFADTYGIEEFRTSLRVISASLSSVQLIGERELDPAQRYVRLTDTMLTSVQHDRVAKSVLGAFYVLTLEDGSFFILDGGLNKGTIGSDYYLWSMLNKLYERLHGHKPTKEEPIVIAGWFLTHAHVDHISTLQAFCRRYADDYYPLRFENFFANLMSESEHFNVCGSEPVQTWESLLGDFAARVRCVKLHTGDRFYLRNAAFEVLHTHEDTHPFMLDYYNESSTVMRVTIRHTDGAGHETGVPVQWLLTGDMNRYTGKLMLAAYGEYLQTEMITVAHHGWVGPRRIFYDAVQPKILWWPTFRQEFKYMTKEGQQNNSWYHLRVDHYIAHDLSTVRYIFVQDTYDTTLVLGKNGIDYDNITESMFDLMDERPLLFNEDSFIKK